MRDAMLRRRLRARHAVNHVLTWRRHMNPKFQASVQHREDVSYVKLSGVIDEDNELGTPGRQARHGHRGHRRLGDRAHQLVRRARLGELARQGREGRRQGRAGRVLAGDRRADQPGQQLHRPRRGQELLRARTSAPTATRRRCCSSRPATCAGSTPFKAPTCRCDECDGPMDFDDMEDSYFAFLAQREEDRHRLARRHA